MTWIMALLVSVGIVLGFAGGSWFGAKALAPKTPWKKEIVSYKLPGKKSEIVQTSAIVYNSETYYPSSFVNTWLRNKLVTDKRLRNVA